MNADDQSNGIEHGTERHRVLVVEDDAFSRDMLVRLVEDAGHPVSALIDGPACLQIFEEDGELPALILLDINMPGMSGIEVLRWIRRRHPADRMPVILVSALADEADIVRGLEAGANDYVTKPIQPPVLLARMQAAMAVRDAAMTGRDAARDREVLAAFGQAVDHIQEPLKRLTERLRAIPPGMPAADLEVALTECREDGDTALNVAGRLRHLSQLRERPWSEGLQGLIAASLEQLGDSPPE